MVSLKSAPPASIPCRCKSDLSVALLQPLVPQYREDFFLRLGTSVNMRLFVFEGAGSSICQTDRVRCEHLPCLHLGCIRVFSVLPILRARCKFWVLLAAPKTPGVWLLLLLGRLLRKKIVLWGHGISIRSYLEYEKKMPLLWRFFYSWADAAWFYTFKEKKIWEKVRPLMPSAALGNTISGVEGCLQFRCRREELAAMREKHGIHTPFNFIFCARFISSRRTDVLCRLIRELDPARFGFIIIGDGAAKPDLSRFSNVYDFGRCYDRAVKSELFSIADVYLQPAWLGLSVVEAMAYGKPVLTLRRAPGVSQCVEYGFVEAAGCGFFAESPEDMKRIAETTSLETWREMGDAARRYVAENLTMDKMVARAVGLLKELGCG